MIYSIDDNRIKNLEVEQLMNFMLKDYPQILEAFVWDVIPLLRYNNMLWSVNNFKESLIILNYNILDKGLDTEEEKKFIEQMNEIYKKYLKNRESKRNLKNVWNVYWQIKELEDNEKNDNIDLISSLVENLNSII